MILEKRSAAVLETMWSAYLRDNLAEFKSRLEFIARRNILNDQLYISQKLLEGF